MKGLYQIMLFFFRWKSFLTITLFVLALPGNSQTPPYPIHWINVIGANSNGTSLSKTAPFYTWVASGAVSSNVLEPNQDGWIEFTASNGYYIVGLASNNNINYDQFSHAVMINSSTNSYTLYEGSSAVGSGTRHSTDVFRISREGGTLKYYMNGLLIRSTAVGQVLLRTKASIAQPSSSAPLLFASFDAQVIVQGIPHAVEGNQLGSISLSVFGGKPPYTYSWSSGELTSSIVNKPQGTYSAIVSDAMGRTKTFDYTIGYKVNWTNAIGLSSNGSRLTKTQPHYTWIAAGAFSSNTLAANVDGWMEFTAESAGSQIVGLTSNNTIDLTEFNNGIQIDYFTNAYKIYEGNTVALSGYWQVGDVFRISREGSNIKYSKNGLVFRSVIVNPAFILRIKSSIQRPGATTPNINCSFQAKLILQAYVVGLIGNSGSGTLTASVAGGASPYDYSWSTGESTNAIVNKQRGVYTLSVNDGIGRTATHTYNVGYRVNWASVSNVSVTGSILTKTSPYHLWNQSGGVSSNILKAHTEGWIEFSAANNASYVVGLASNNIIDLTQFNYAIAIDYLKNSFVIYEGNAAVKTGNLEIGDVFRISREGSQVKYYQNESVVRTVAVNSGVVLRVKTSILRPGTSSPHINSSFWNSDGVVRTYFAIADGNWTTPSIWSLSENGPPSSVYPDEIDKVVIKGYEVTVDSFIKSAGVTITSINNNTLLRLDGTMASLAVKGNILMNGEQGSDGGEMLVVQNAAKLDVK